MLEVLGQSQGWEISSSPPGSAPRPKPSPVPKGANPHFSLEIIYYSKFSQASASLVLPGKPLRSQFTPRCYPNPEAMPSPTLGIACYRRMEIFGTAPSRTGKPGASSSLFQNSFFPSKAKRWQNLLVSLTQTLESKQRWKTPSTGIFFSTWNSLLGAESRFKVTKLWWNPGGLNWGFFCLKTTISGVVSAFPSLHLHPFCSPGKPLGKTGKQLHGAFPKCWERWQQLNWAPHKEMFLLGPFSNKNPDSLSCHSH